MKIIVSNSSRGAYHGLVKDIKSRLLSQSKNIVIAPDRFTASVERGLILSLGINSTFNLEVASFTRLAARLLGGDIHKCLTPEGSVLLISSVIKNCADKLSYYGKVWASEGFASELYAAITSIRNSGVSTEQLQAASQKMPPQKRRKLNDILLVYKGYMEALEGRHSDSSTRLYALADFILANPSCVADVNFYVTDMYEFSAPEIKILQALGKHALSLTVSLTSGFDNKNRRIYPDRVIRRLEKLAEGGAQIEYALEPLEPPVDIISKYLFSYARPQSPAENSGKVTLRRQTDAYEEALALALDIVKGVREGRRYKDFEVYLCDMDKYQRAIKEVFGRYGIPFFLDRKELLKEQTKVRYLLQVLAAVRSGLRRREVLELVKNPLFYLGLDGGEDSVFIFENYVLKYNIDATRFSNPFTLKSEDGQHKTAFRMTKCADKPSVNEKEENEIPEQVRQKLVRVLSVFPLEETDVHTLAEAARKCLLAASEAWAEHVRRLSELSAYYVKCAEQVDAKLEEALSEAERVIDGPMTVKDFEIALSDMLGALKIALVPTFLDCVFVGDKDSRFMGLGDLYVIGALNDSFPHAAGSGAVLTGEDEELLEGAGIDICPNERQRMTEGMYAVCDLLKKPRGRLVISYPQTGGGGQLRPSTVIYELKSLLVQDGRPLEEESVRFDGLYEGGELSDVAATLFSTKRSAMYEVLGKLASGRAPLEDRPLYASALMTLDKAEADRVDRLVDVPTYIGAQEGANHCLVGSSTSVSRLETFYRCPYQHYMQYILRLKKRKDGEPEGTENGIILHYMLEQLFKLLRDGDASEDRLDELAYEWFDEAVKENGFEILLQKPQTARTLLRLRNEGAYVLRQLYGIQKRSQFKPFMLEEKIGGDILRLTLDDGSSQTSLIGYIDRVDKLDDKFFIVDYKTYKGVSLTPTDLYYGGRLQLYLYMRAVEKSLSLEPVGVCYLPIYSQFTKENVDRFKLTGQVSCDPQILQQMDGLFEQSPEKAFIPYKLARGKELSGEVHLGKNDFDMLGGYAEKLALKGVRLIESGYIKPSPADGEDCDRCAYGGICAYKAQYARKQPKVPMQTFVDIEEAQNER